MSPSLRLLLLGLVAACSASTTDPGFAAILSVDHVRGVSVSLAVSPSNAARRDSIEFVVTAHNSTNESVQIGDQCGPPFDVLISGPDGSVVSVLALILGPNGAFTCEMSPLHFAPAKGSQQLRLRIAAPQRFGQYSAVAGLRRREGLSNLSAAATFSVR